MTAPKYPFQRDARLRLIADRLRRNYSTDMRRRLIVLLQEGIVADHVEIEVAERVRKRRHEARLTEERRARQRQADAPA